MFLISTTCSNGAAETSHTGFCCYLLRLTHPKVVHDGDGALELLRDLHTDVLVEAGAHRAERRQRGPVVLTGFRKQGGKKKQDHLYSDFLQPPHTSLALICVLPIVPCPDLIIYSRDSNTGA